MKGMLVFTLRAADGEFTLNGVSSQHSTFLLVGPGVPEVHEDNGRYPVLHLVKRSLGGAKPYLHAEPLERPVGKLGPMAGGNYIMTSDSRFRQEVNEYPVPVHDRFETQEQYDFLSR
jgi:hypothetical protein